MPMRNKLKSDNGSRSSPMSNFKDSGQTTAVVQRDRQSGHFYDDSGTTETTRFTLNIHGGMEKTKHMDIEKLLTSSLNTMKKRSRKCGSQNRTVPFTSISHNISSKCEFNPQTHSTIDYGGSNRVSNTYFESNGSRQPWSSDSLISCQKDKTRIHLSRINKDIRSPLFTESNHDANTPGHRDSSSPPSTSSTRDRHGSTLSGSRHSKTRVSLERPLTNYLDTKKSREKPRDSFTLENSSDRLTPSGDSVNRSSFSTKNLKFHSSVQPSLTLEDSRNMAQKPFFFGRTPQDPSNPPAVLTREQCIWDLHRLRKNLVSKCHKFSRRTLDGYSSSVLPENDSFPSSDVMHSDTWPHPLHGTKHSPRNGGVELDTSTMEAPYSRCDTLIKSLESENAYLRDCIARQTRKITVLEAHMERDEGIISRQQQQFNSVRTYLKKLKRDCETTKTLDPHLSHLLSFLSDEPDKTLSPMLCIPCTDAALDEKFYFQGESTQQPRLSKSYDSSFCHHSPDSSLPYLKENESHPHVMYPNYPADKTLSGYSMSKLTQNVCGMKKSTVVSGSTMPYKSQPNIKKNRSSLEKDTELKPTMLDKSPPVVNGDDSSTLTTGCSSRHPGASAKSVHSKKVIRLESDPRDAVTSEEKGIHDGSTHPSIQTSLLGKSYLLKFTEKRHERRKPPPVPLLGLEKKNVGFGSWLSGEATQGDTYNTPVHAVPSN